MKNFLIIVLIIPDFSIYVIAFKSSIQPIKKLWNILLKLYEIPKDFVFLEELSCAKTNKVYCNFLRKLVLDSSFKVQ